MKKQKSQPCITQTGHLFTRYIFFFPGIKGIRCLNLSFLTLLVRSQVRVSLGAFHERRTSSALFAISSLKSFQQFLKRNPISKATSLITQFPEQETWASFRKLVKKSHADMLLWWDAYTETKLENWTNGLRIVETVRVFAKWYSIKNSMLCVFVYLQYYTKVTFLHTTLYNEP